MRRLTHSLAGYRRAMQMSRNQIFAFVEGQTDPYFYDRICESVCQPLGVSYEIRRAQELPGGTGGKAALLALYEYLKRMSSLLDNFKDKSTGTIIFLDKDVDDLLRKQRRSEHIVYTKYYDLENHLYIHGDLGKAAAASASMERSLVVTRIGNYEQWRQTVAEQWKEWIKLCLFTRKRKINSECNYSVASRINNPVHGPVDMIAHHQRVAILESRSGLPPMKFRRAFRNISHFVDGLYARGEHDRIFKGKWYSIFLEQEIKNIAGVRPINANGLVGRLPIALALTLNFDEPWAEHFKEPVRKLIRRL